MLALLSGRARAWSARHSVVASRRLATPRLLSSSSSDDNDSNDNSPSTTSTTTTTTTTATQSFQNTNNIRDQVFSALSADGGIKVTACTVRNLVNDLLFQHTLNETPAHALGKTVVCGLLMANGMPDEHVVQITLQTNTAPLRGVVCLVTGAGGVKGYVGTPGLATMPLPQALGRDGSVQIVKNHPDWPRPYSGITAMVHGDVDRDIGRYLAESEQRSCALAAATQISGILCTAAGGYLVEQLPGVEEATVEKVQENLAKLVAEDGGDQLPTNLLQSGVSPLDMAAMILEGLDMVPLQEIEPKLECECSEDRLYRAVRLLPPEDVEDILEKEDKVEARCQFCGKVYEFQADDLRSRMERDKDIDPSRD